MLFTNILLVVILFGIARLGHDLELILKEQKKTNALIQKEQQKRGILAQIK